MNKKKLELKKIKRKDLETVVKWRNNSEIMKYTTKFFLLIMEHQNNWLNYI